MPKNRFKAAVLAICVAIISTGTLTADFAAAEPPVTTPTPTPDTRPDPKAGPKGANGVAAAERDKVLGREWRSSDDLAWTLAGDPTGLHLLTATAASGYAWRTVTTLAEPGFETDRWIGNACVTASGRRAVVAYAPRSFENQAVMTQRGAFLAVVDLQTGAVRKLAQTGSLAYFSPGCGTGEQAVITQEGDRAATRLLSVNAEDGKVTRAQVVRGQVTSAIPSGTSIVAARGPALIKVDTEGAVKRLARGKVTPFLLTADAQGGVVYADRQGSRTLVRRTAADGTRTVTTGPWGKVGIAPGRGGRVFVTGETASSTALPANITRLQVPSRSEPSLVGDVAVTTVDTSDPRVPETDRAKELDISMLAVATGQQVRSVITPGQLASARTVAARKPSPARQGKEVSRTTASSPTNPIDTDRTCSIPRNDATTQVYQPTPRQVEWAADQAVVGALTTSRPANWKQSGLPAYTPQGLFPSIPLTGGGRVNVQILLGILAQESNLWQASNHALSGEFGNPLVGNYYGRNVYDGVSENDWVINFAEADCGYGIAQVTDGMRNGQTLWTATQRRAIAMDYAANLSAGLRILQQKWNETKGAGLTVDGGNPQYIESWFFAVWAYNSGFHANKGDGSPWGVGWLNNPINPRYKADRAPFLENSYADARDPQLWPYPEKVLGWAGHPIDTLDGTGFRAAWWTTVDNRKTVKPPLDEFCNFTNNCFPGAFFQPNAPGVEGAEAGPCAHKNAAGQYDLECWYNQPVSWKNNCASACGYELLRFNTTYPEQPDGTNYPPNCVTAGLPSGALIIDDTTAPAPRAGCGRPFTNSGSFGLSFGADASGNFPSKVDFHQVGGGFAGHFWFAHSRNSSADPTGKFRVTGTWTLNRSLNQWARVMVHMPDHGAHTQQAAYTVSLGNGTTKKRVILQRTKAHRWVSLGVFQFAGTPKVSLSSATLDGDGSEDVAFDAVAFQPLTAKPRTVMVALGDSYSSGEGASAPDGSDYYTETDIDGGVPIWGNTCHRSRQTWSRKATLKDSTASIGSRADAWDTAIDYNLLACSGATTENLLPKGTKNAFNKPGVGQYGEFTQLDRGFLDSSTTLVTLSVGGNDARFADIIAECVYAAGPMLCQNAKLAGDTQPMSQAVPQRIAGPVRQSIVIVLRQIHALAPNAKIVLMGYPALLENRGGCVPGIGTEEAPWINDTAAVMATQMEGAARDATAAGAPTTFSDVRDEFAGEAICGSPETIHGINTVLTPGESRLLVRSAQSFHPKITGQANYTDALNGTLRAMGL